MTLVWRFSAGHLVVVELKRDAGPETVRRARLPEVVCDALVASAAILFVSNVVTAAPETGRVRSTRRPPGDPPGDASPARSWSRTSFRSSLVPMVVADDERRYVAANAAACLLLRLPEEEVLKRTIEDLTPPENRSRIGPLWDTFIRDGTQRGTFELLMPDGPRVLVEYSATANVQPGRHLSILMFPPGRGDHRLPDPAPARTILTAREREVLGMVAMGMGSSWIAQALGVSSSTVETHVRHCLDKLGARNRAHAIALGLRTGEIRLDLDPGT
jgi:PAS domain S-box-containing protein